MEKDLVGVEVNSGLVVNNDQWSPSGILQSGSPLDMVRSGTGVVRRNYYLVPELETDSISDPSSRPRWSSIV